MNFLRNVLKNCYWKIDERYANYQFETTTNGATTNFLKVSTGFKGVTITVYNNGNIVEKTYSRNVIPMIKSLYREHNIKLDKDIIETKKLMKDNLNLFMKLYTHDEVMLQTTCELIKEENALSLDSLNKIERLVGFIGQEEVNEYRRAYNYAQGVMHSREVSANVRKDSMRKTSPSLLRQYGVAE